MKRIDLLSVATILVASIAILSTPVQAESGGGTYGHCRDGHLEYDVHQFVDTPTGTVCRTCAGSDGGGCHDNNVMYYCGPGMLAQHNDCPGQ
jgi:hypothetical protein